MNTVPSGTVIGYDAVSGEELFTEKNRATRFPDQTDALPQANDLYKASNGKTYRVVGVRKSSTEMTCEIDVREEPPTEIPPRVNSGKEGEKPCECGRVWLLAKRNEPQRDKDDISCTCGRTLVSWNGGCVWTAKLIKDVD